MKVTKNDRDANRQQKNSMSLVRLLLGVGCRNLLLLVGGCCCCCSKCRRHCVGDENDDDTIDSDNSNGIYDSSDTINSGDEPKKDATTNSKNNKKTTVMDDDDESDDDDDDSKGEFVFLENSYKMYVDVCNLSPKPFRHYTRDSLKQGMRKHATYRNKDGESHAGTRNVITEDIMYTVVKEVTPKKYLQQALKVLDEDRTTTTTTTTNPTR